VAVLSFGGVVWLALPLVAAAALVLRAHPWSTLGRVALPYLVLAALFALPSLLTAKGFLEPAKGVVTDANELGNLIEPLNVAQIAGVWPAGDFRVDPDHRGFTSLLILLVLAAACAGVVVAVRRRAWGLAMYALATASPALLVAALAGCAALAPRYLTLAALAGTAIAAGVLWSNALAFHDVSLAPRDRLHELEEIGDDLDGRGPTLMMEYEPYGVRHFLRKGDPEGASELRRRFVYLRTGGTLDKGGNADVDAFRLDQLEIYRTLVPRRSPVASRPPSNYRLVRSGDYYETWQRPATVDARIAEHLPVGDGEDPVGAPKCSEVRRLAGVAGRGGRLVASTRDAPTVVKLGPLASAAGWTADPGNELLALPPDEGALRADVTTPSGPVELWIGGSFRRTLAVSVDGREVARLRHELEPAGGYTPLARIEPGPGRHAVELKIEDSALKPGGGGPVPGLGPLVVSRATAAPWPALLQVPAARARELCRPGIDWIEAVRP
jgi:hypothetical protein